MKDIEGYEGIYAACEDGRIYSYQRNGTLGKYLKPCIASGYALINLSKDNIRKSFSVHRLMASTFIPNPENKPQVNHKNCIKTDNRIDNLEWATREENMQHAHKNGLVNMPRGSNHHRSKLSESDIPKIKQLKKQGLKLREIAPKFNVGIACISKVIRGDHWK